MPGLAHGSVLISVVVILFAALLIATPPLAMLTHPRDAPAWVPAKTSYVSAVA